MTQALTIIFTFGIFSIGSLAQEVEKDKNKPTSSNILTFDKISKFNIEEVKQADFIAYYSMNGKLDINIGLSKDGVDHQIKFGLNELKRFFDKQKHKDLIVVIMESHRLSDNKINIHAKTLYGFFVARGYKKVIIQQGEGK